MSKEDIYVQTGNTIGLNNINLDIYDHETFVVMGLSGSGKSTLLRCINRLIPATRGEILIGEYNVVNANKTDLRHIRRTKMAMVFQNFALLPHKNVIDNVGFGLEIQGISESKRHSIAQEVLETVGLGEYGQAKIQSLSGGMKQRVGLARALAVQTDILLMDEAFSALDPLIRTNMQDELVNLQKTIKKTIVFISHDLDEALKLGDRIALMNDGKVVQIGNAKDILENPANDYVERFVENVDRDKYLN